MAGATGKMTGDGNAEMKFNPNDPLDDGARAALACEDRGAASLPTASYLRAAHARAVAFDQQGYA